MSNSKIQTNFAIVGLLSIIIIVLCTQIILNLETNSESFTEDGIFIVPLLFFEGSASERFIRLPFNKYVGSINKKSGWLLSMIFFSMFELDEYFLKISLINTIDVCFFPIPSGP